MSEVIEKEKIQLVIGAHIRTKQEHSLLFNPSRKLAEKNWQFLFDQIKDLWHMAVLRGFCRDKKFIWMVPEITIASKTKPVSRSNFYSVFNVTVSGTL